MQFYSKKFNELTQQELYEILKARQQVFLLEQGIVREDMDGIDQTAMHCFLTDEGHVCAYIRAHRLDDDTVKIMRVISLIRGGGMGRKIMEQTVEAVKEKLPCKSIVVDAQARARGYYEKMGFKVVGDEFFFDSVTRFKMEYKINGR